ncbi:MULTISPECIES: flagellar biosynthesis protein FliQ [Cohaesibacter]|uniref:flagellar biosynthesis protein FliQ n=1 Tax=Cohaesibacter TaxID=655352 RepID=UPI000DEBA2A1|nr:MULTISPECIES: flagellar biosynthesis protein FliQ [Cohaesibacter]TLP48544.1 flagellar biosynthesis protein FliQ [Cohaesibacter sp. CAU 1516]
MTGPEMLDIAREGLWVMLKISGPIMVVGLIVGVVIALFQALTQIQEMTLVFVPKIIAIFIALMIALPFIGATLGTFTQFLMERVISG